MEAWVKICWFLYKRKSCLSICRYDTDNETLWTNFEKKNNNQWRPLSPLPYTPSIYTFLPPFQSRLHRPKVFDRACSKPSRWHKMDMRRSTVAYDLPKPIRRSTYRCKMSAEYRSKGALREVTFLLDQTKGNYIQTDKD